MERVDYEMPKILTNILDPNTSPTAKRILTIKMEFKPDADRTGFSTDFSTKVGLAPTNPIRTSMYICGEDSTGAIQVVEMVPQVPGQVNLEGAEQEAPPVLKLINFN
jgi:hypothetical protein